MASGRGPYRFDRPDTFSTCWIALVGNYRAHRLTIRRQKQLHALLQEFCIIEGFPEEKIE